MRDAGPNVEEAPVTLTVQARVRRCRREDLRALEWFGAFTPHRRIIRDVFDRQERGEALMLLLDFRGAPIGQVWLELPKAGTGSLWGLRVFPWFQRLGLGTRLVRAGERVLRQQGATRIELNVDRGNADARRFYERLGYRVSGEYCDTFSYRSPSGLQRTVELDQWVLAKQVEASAGVDRSQRPDGRD